MEQKTLPKTKKSRIASIFRRWMLSILVLILLTSILLINGVSRVAVKKDTYTMLRTQVSDLSNELTEHVSSSMHDILYAISGNFEQYVSDAEYAKYMDEKAKESVTDGTLQDGLDGMDMLLQETVYVYRLTEANLIDPDGVIRHSTNPEEVGFDMYQGHQSKDFMDGIEKSVDHAFVQEYMPRSLDSKENRKYAGIRLTDNSVLQFGYNGADLSDISFVFMQQAAKNRRIGRTGYFIAVEEDGNIAISPKKELINKSCLDYGYKLEALAERATGEPFEVRVLGEDHYVVESRVNGYYIMAAIPKSEVISSVQNMVLLFSGVGLFILVVLWILNYRLVQKLIIDDVQTVDNALSKITAGDLSVTVDARTTAEFDSLSDNINSTVTALKEYAEEEKRRMEKDLNHAREIQRSMLPVVFPERTDFEIFATMNTAKEVGGDFFGFEMVNSDILYFCVADVSGKGIPAALFMMRAKTIINSFSLAGLTPKEIILEVNSRLCTSNSSGMFVTCWLGALNLNTGMVTYVNAGHNYPLIRKNGGTFEYLKTKGGFVLAGMEDFPYQQNSEQLQPGDEIFLYTDGVTEATNISEELFGDERLQNALNAQGEMNCKERCEDIQKALDEFVGSAPQFDDITMLSLKYKGR